MLQSVSVAVGGDGSISSVDGVAIVVDEATGASSATSTSYDPASVVDALPVRVSTLYKTTDGVGTDLGALDGYTGRVRIDLTVESLTLAPSMLEYDVAGRARNEVALVGAPLTVAGSTRLSGTAASDIISSTDGSGNGTNGIVSSSKGGDGIVQWAALIAVPQTGSAATFTLEADVEDFSVPAIDLTVQRGVRTDLSFDGTLASAFDDGPTSALGLQRRTISVISDVNAILARAGSTITEVRTNLEETSNTLGVRTIGQLHTSTVSLSESMLALGDRIVALRADLGSSVGGTQSAMTAQLDQIVAAVEKMLGDTRASRPDMSDGDGCDASVNPADAGGSLADAFLQLSGQLAAYAEATADCRDEAVAALQRTVGPALPDAQSCTDASLTCALFDSSQTVSIAMIELVVTGQDIVDRLEPELTTEIVEISGLLTADTAAVAAEVDRLADSSPGTDAVDALAALEAALNAMTIDLDALDALHGIAGERLDQLGSVSSTGSILEQNARLGEELCALGAAGRLDQLTVDRLRSYIVPTMCDSRTELTPPAGYSASMQARLDDQVSAWSEVRSVTDIGKEESAAAGLRAALASAQGALSEAQSAALQAASMDESIGALDALSTVMEGHTQSLTEATQLLETQQEALPALVLDGFQDAADGIGTEAAAALDRQIRVVTDRANVGRDALVEAYARTIDGLSATADDVEGNSAEIIDAQRDRLVDGRTAAVSDLDEQTVAAFSLIAQSADASTRDVEAASALLNDSLNQVLLDLGDRTRPGSGILGAMSANAAKAGSADTQLALASQNAAAYALGRSDDIAGILLRQAQFAAVLGAVDQSEPFHLDLPSDVTSETTFSFTIGRGND